MTKEFELREKYIKIIKDEAKNGYLYDWKEAARMLSEEQQLDYFADIVNLLFEDAKQAGCIILDREKLKKLPKTITNKQMAEAYGGYDFMTKDMRAVCRKEQRNMLKRFEDCIEEL